jgi:hypothetical protein
MADKVEKIQIEFSVTLGVEQIKELALTTPGDAEAVIQLLNKLIVAKLDKCYLKWLPGPIFSDDDYECLYNKWNDRPFKEILAMQELAREHYGILDQLADI